MYGPGFIGSDKLSLGKIRERPRLIDQGSIRPGLNDPSMIKNMNQLAFSGTQTMSNHDTGNP
jgi:hypothetical protein